MKKTLKFALVISVIFSLLIGNVSVLAVNVIDEISNNQVSTEANENNEKNAEIKNQVETEPNTDANVSSGDLAIPEEEEDSEKLDNSNENSKPQSQPNEEPNNKESLPTNDLEGTGFADEKNTVDGGNSILENLIQKELVSDPEGAELEALADTVADSKGKLFATIDLRLPQINQKESSTSIFDVFLKKDGLSTKPTEFSKGSSEVKDEMKLYYTFDNVDAGSYTLEITGAGYVKYTKNIEIIPGIVSEIHLTNGNKENGTDILNGNQIGIVPVGDVTNDGKIVGYDLAGKTPDGENSNDEEEMIKALDNKSSNLKYDLNGDGKIDIVDLSYISINKNKEPVNGTVFESVDISEATIGVSDTTEVNENNGTIKDILKNNDKYITLSPKDPNADISEDNAVEITLNLKEDAIRETKEITIAPSSNPENNIEGGTISIETDEGTIQAIIGDSSVSKVNKVALFSKKTNTIDNVYAKIEPDGTISVDLGKKVAVKKITIKVTATKSNKFADIAKVEFLNGNEDRIPAPELAIPKITHFDASSGQNFTVTWENMVNVTGYEVKIRAMTKSGEKTEVYSVDGNSITISDFHGAIEDNIPATYYVAVQSVNGEWRSGYGEETAILVDAVSKPAPPDNLTLKGGVRKIEASWKKMNATNSYKVFYRKYDEGNYIEATMGKTLETPNYTIEGLEDNQRYQVYVVGVNKHGESGPSKTGVVETSNILPAQMPQYKLINTPQGEGKLTAHIVSAMKMSKDEPAKNEMRDSPLDTDSTWNGIRPSAKGTVDNNYNSHLFVNDWDFGGYYPSEDGKGVRVTFDKAYKMYYFAFAQIENLDTFSRANIYYKNMTTNKMVGPISTSQVIRKTGENGRHYFVIKLAEPIETDTVQICVGRPYGYIGKITIAEMRFYEYDSLEHDIYDLYADQMHTTLKESVTEEKLNELQNRINTQDPVSKEYNPERESLQKELDLARLIYNNKGLNNAIKIDTTVTKAKDGHITFNGGLNAWQPLGVVAPSNKTIKVYVGSPDKQSGDSTNLDLIATQYHPEAANWCKVAVTSLKVGLNEVTLPEIGTQDKEKGGSLYIEYKGNNPNEVYGVRVDGGEEIPVLDLSKINKEDYTSNKVFDADGFEMARKDAVRKYVEELENVVPKLSEAHENHKETDGLKYNYKAEECISGATEIVLDQMMYSVSSQQILAGLGEGDTATKSEKLYKSLVAMEDMVDLFYSHKGLNKDTSEPDRNTYPSSRLNIRYHQMFAGAAMYAGGLHIGIEWGDVPTLAGGVPITTTADGKYSDGKYFGWGIAHEIGHIIDEGAYEHAEVTNNYFSVLAQAQDTNESVRFEYPEVYKKVMSGKTGKAQNVFTQLGLYWQLHLAYDKGGYNFKTFSSYEEQQKNLLFARIDSYARTPSLAPKATENGIELKLMDSGADAKDNNLMRLACAAAEKNILDFFIKWGMTPNIDTIRYAMQWDKEDRAIYFVNDNARAYQLAGGLPMSDGATVSATAEIVKEGITNTNRVELTLTNTNLNSGAMLGYEIVRTYMDNDEEKVIPVAFVTIDDGDGKNITYTDTIETFNNRVFTYKVTGYDKYLTATEQYVLEPIKVEHDGTIGGKEDWTVTTNLTSEADKQVSDANSKDVDTSDGAQTVKGVSELVDGNYDIEYVGNTKDDENAQITIELDEVKKIVGFKYTSKEELGNYKVEVNKTGDAGDWKEVKTINTPTKQGFIATMAKIFKINNEDTKTVYFGEADRLDVYDAAFIRFTISGSHVSMNELDLIGQTGDNVDFVKTSDGHYGIGKLTNDVILGQSDETHEDVKIPANSIVFTGTYKGNPAYNALKLWDENNELLVGSEQTFYAEPLEEGHLITDVTDGIWIYWLEPKIWMDAEGNQVDLHTEGASEVDNPMYTKFSNPTEGMSVRAELYRVDDAHELTGERIVSDTYRVPVNSLPDITITSDGKVNE